MRVDSNSKFGQTHFPVLNGEIIRGAMEADDVEGWVEVIVSYAHTGRPITERLHGKVTFVHAFEIEEDPYEAYYR